MQLHEKYRPKTWPEVVGQPKAVRVLTALREHSGFAGRSYWVSGASGTGKTTVAHLIASEIADKWFIEELDAGDLTPARIRTIEESWGTYSTGKGGRAYIVNEAHGLRRDTVKQLLITLERVPSHVAVLFTTTTDGELQLFEATDDAGPLLSRCIVVPLTNQGLAKAFGAMVKRHAEMEGLDGQPIARYVSLAQKCRNNARAMYQAIEAGAMLA